MSGNPNQEMKIENANTLNNFVRPSIRLEKNIPGNLLAYFRIRWIHSFTEIREPLC